MAAHQLYLYNFPPFIEEKYYFIHAISVHSSAGASLDSQCHLHADILINGRDVSTACSWGEGGRTGGRVVAAAVVMGGCSHVVQRGYIQ